MRKWLLPAALLLSPVASAQYDFMDTAWFNMTMNHMMINSMMLEDMRREESDRLRNEAVQKAVDAQRARLEPKGKAVIAAGKASTAFRAAPGPLALDAFTQALAGDPAQRTQAREALNTLLNEYRKLSAQYGLSTTDLADGMSFVAGASYETLTAGAQDLGKNDLAALRTRIRPRVLADPVVQGMSDAERQELQESLVLLTMVGLLRYEAAGQQRAEGPYQEARGLLTGLFEELVGAPYQKVRFTPQGLVVGP